MVRAFVSSVSWGGAVRHPMSAICTSPWVRRQVEIIDHICETVTRGFAICSADEMFQRILLGWQYFLRQLEESLLGLREARNFRGLLCARAPVLEGRRGGAACCTQSSCQQEHGPHSSHQAGGSRTLHLDSSSHESYNVQAQSRNGAGLPRTCLLHPKRKFLILECLSDGKSSISQHQSWRFKRGSD